MPYCHAFLRSLRGIFNAYDRTARTSSEHLPMNPLRMNITTLQRNAAALLVLGMLFAAAALALPSSARAATCTFTSNLELGVESEAVRCLQRYLNENGFTVSASGVGSKGRETNQYQTKTVAAVQKWQTANGISPATGTFGPISRAKYIVLTSPSAPVPTIPVPQPTTRCI